MFDKSTKLFPIKDNYIYLAHCAVSPLYSKACEREKYIAEEHQNLGGLLLGRQYEEILEELRKAGSDLFNADSQNVTFLKNTSEGMSMIASGYRFSPDDQVIGYVHEYPANYYPWKLQERRGVEYVLLPNQSAQNAYSPDGQPVAWTMEDLQARVTKNTRIVAISHVQFTSGFAADLQKLGDFCQSHDIDLVVDAAQSFGSLPLYPEKWHISAMVSSGWKWLLGPVGTGLMYTSDKFREKLDPVMVGAEVMQQGTDYLNHAWDPHLTAKRFEYSTSPLSLAAALATCINDIHSHYGVEAIAEEIFRLQDIIVAKLDNKRYKPLVFSKENRSGILAVTCLQNPPEAVAERLQDKNIICSARGGYLRIAPHFYNGDDEMEKTAAALNAIDQ